MQSLTQDCCALEGWPKCPADCADDIAPRPRLSAPRLERLGDHSPRRAVLPRGMAGDPGLDPRHAVPQVPAPDTAQEKTEPQASAQSRRAGAVRRAAIAGSMGVDHCRGVTP